MEKSIKHWQRQKHYIIPIRFLNREVTFTIDQKTIDRARTVGQFFGIILFTGCIVYTLLINTAPLGVIDYHSLSKDQFISEPGPKERVTIKKLHGEKIFFQNHDLSYFTTRMPFPFDKATVKVTYQNPDPDQIIEIGFQDQEQFHFDTKPLDVPFLNSLMWKKTGAHPTLYQREPNFETVDDFITHPPMDAIIGTFAYDAGMGNIFQAQVPDYQPAYKETIITAPLRGKHIFYAYLKDEPFTMTIQKQDLNWYTDLDVMTVKIYKDGELVYQTSADDDGIHDSSGKSKPPQEIIIKNPGPDLPENGVYKIVIDANGDTIIKRISTNLHKIIFQGSLYPAANREQYHSVIASTSATTVYTNALALSAKSYHTAGLQTIFVDNQLLTVNTLKDNQIITPQAELAKVIIPRNDIILSAHQGYFAFEPEHFFLPSQYHVMPVTSHADINLVDYILADYSQPKKQGTWQVNEMIFDIRGATIKDGKLNWIISAPKLKENDRQLIIKDIEITFEKKPWI
jgi:hypothetical protein